MTWRVSVSARTTRLDVRQRQNCAGALAAGPGGADPASDRDECDGRRDEAVASGRPASPAAAGQSTA